VAIVLNVPKVKREVIATGPVCRYGEEANSAATNGGIAPA
jgi:hypothetical protein